jgi:cell division protein FtsZ
MGKAMMGTGEAEGPNRAIAAAEAAISNPLLDDVSMKGARGVLINITGGLDMTLFEVDEAANRVRSEVDPEANIIFGSTFDQSLEGKVRISVVATGIEGIAGQQPRPVSLSLVSNVGRAVAAAPSAERVEPSPANAIQATGMEIRRETAGATALAAAPASMPIADSAPGPIVAEAARANLSQPALSQPIPQPATPTMHEPMLQRPASARDERPFIAPPPVERVTSSSPATAPAAPHQAEASAQQPSPPLRRIPNLFSRVTGSAWGRGGSAESRQPVTPQLRASPAPRTAPAAAAPIAPAATPAPAPQASPSAQPRLSGLDPKDRLSVSRAEEDLLDIPAFLRRQAN